MAERVTYETASEESEDDEDENEDKDEDEEEIEVKPAKRGKKAGGDEKAGRQAIQRRGGAER